MKTVFRISMIPNLLKWHFTKKTIPIICHVVLTNRCNYRCTFCFVDQKSPNYLPFDTFTHLVDDLKKAGCCYLYVSGGEPLTVPGIVDYLKYAAKRIPHTHLVTNGSLLKGDLLEAISASGLSEISVSINGLEDLHDRSRKEGAFKAALEAIKAIKKRSGPSVTCSTTIGLWNAFDMQGLTELIDSLSVPQRFIIYLDYPISSKKWGSDNLDLASVEEITSFVRYYLKKHDDALLPFAPSFLKAKVEGTQFNPPVLKEPCTLPSYYVNVLWQGEVFPCLGMRSSLYPGVGIVGKAGDFKISEKESLLSIIKSPEYREIQEKLLDCRECFRFFASCYVRPRLSFPLGNFIKYRLLKRGKINRLHL